MQNFYSPRLFRFLTIVFMACLCLLFNYLTQINCVKIELPKNRPDYNGYGAEGLVYDKNGNIMYELKSESLWQFPQNDRLFMTNLHCYIYTESVTNSIKYDLKADDGWMNYNKQLGFLGNNAVLIINNPNPKQITTLYGKDINLDMMKNYFDSAESIKAIQNGSVISGHGFSYEQNSGILKINSQVKIEYLEYSK